MKTLNLTPAIQVALLQAVEMNIDMLNDMALDPLWFNGKEIRELACKSDTEIRAVIVKHHEEAFENIEQLVSLQILYSELKAE